MERAAIVPADSQRVLESMGNGERAEEVLIASGKYVRGVMVSLTSRRTGKMG